MRIPIILTIFRKELTETLRDRRTLVMMLGLPILLYPLIIIGFSKLQESRSEAQEERSSRVVVWGELAPAMRDEIDRAGSITLASWAGASERLRGDIEREALQPPALAPAPVPSVSGRRFSTGPSEPENPILVEARVALASRQVDAVLVTYPGMRASLAAGGVGRLRVYFDSVREESVKARERLLQALEAYRRELVRAREVDLDLTTGFTTGVEVSASNVAAQERRAGQILGTFMPFMLIVLSLLGGFYPAVDLTAGEKERGTMQTLLCAPLRSVEIIVGKFLAVWVIGLIAALANVTSLALTLTRMLPGEVGVSPSAYFLMFVLLLPVTLLFTAVFLAVAVFAKDFKDGQNFLTPVYMVLGVPAAVTMLPGMELSAWTAFVPVVNIALLIKAVLVGDIATDLIFLTLLSSGVYAALAMLLASRVFEREQILLGGGESWAAVLSLDRRPGGTPSPALALVLFASVMVLAFYGSLMLEGLNTVITLFIVEVGFFLAPALAVAAVMRFGWRDTFALRWPSAAQIGGAVIIGLSAWTITGGLLIRLLPPPESLTRALERLLLLDGQPAPLIVVWLVIGITPAVCEELFFRGFVLTGLRSLGRWPAIAIAGFLFGIAHASIYRLLPTLCLGVLFGYIVWRTGSIVVGIVAHALNNGLMATFVQVPSLGDRLGLSQTEFLRWDYTLIGTVLTVLGVAVVIRASSSEPRAQSPESRAQSPEP